MGQYIFIWDEHQFASICQLFWYSHLVIEHSHGKSPCLIGKPSIKGQFSMAMLNNQRVDYIVSPFWPMRGYTSLQDLEASGCSGTALLGASYLSCNQEIAVQVGEVQGIVKGPDLQWHHDWTNRRHTQGLVNVPFWEYWTSPYSSHLVDHIPNGIWWLGDVKNGDI